MRTPIRGIGACDPDPDELAIGWMYVGFSAFQRIDFIAPDADDPETARLELEALTDAAALAAGEEW